MTVSGFQLAERRPEKNPDRPEALPRAFRIGGHASRRALLPSTQLPCEASSEVRSRMFCPDVYCPEGRAELPCGIAQRLIVVNAGTGRKTEGLSGKLPSDLSGNFLLR
jgi:hypothetical protein